jgi:hypothetical protein
MPEDIAYEAFEDAGTEDAYGTYFDTDEGSWEDTYNEYNDYEPSPYDGTYSEM